MPNMMYVNDDGSCSTFSNERDMIGIIKRDAKQTVTTEQRLCIQQVIAGAIQERGGSLYEDNGEVMNGHTESILMILGLESDK